MSRQKKVRILYVHGSANLYGASRSLLRLASRLPASFSPLVVLPEDGPLVEALGEAGMDVIVVPWLQRSVLGRHTFQGLNLIAFALLFVPNVLRFAFLLRKQRAALVHTNNATMIIPALAAAVARVPHIWHIRETLDAYTRQWSRFASTERSLIWRLSSFVALRGWPLYVRFITLFSAKVVCVSAAAGEAFLALGLEEKTCIVYNGIEVPFYSECKVEPLALEPWVQDGAGNCFCFGTVGEIRAGKGQDFFVRAFGKLKRMHPTLDVKCLVIGGHKPNNADYLVHLQRLADELGVRREVIFTGHVPDPRPGFARLDVFVLPSMQAEPFGTVVLEAMAMRKPVIATAIGGSLEQIEDGVSGILVPAGDVDALARAMETLVLDGDVHRQLAENAFVRVNRLFSVDEHVMAVQGVYEALLDRQGYNEGA